jgi:protease IV
MLRNNRPIRPRPLYSNSVPKAVEKPKVKWSVPLILWMALKRGAMALGFLVIFAAIWGSLVFSTLVKDNNKVILPDEMVLVLEFQGGFNEIPPEASLANPFATDTITLRHYLATIDQAAKDDRVKGIVARMREGSFSLTHIEEIRNALKRFKASGKFAHIYSTSFGESGSGLGRYYLASVFDELWMQPLGIVMIAGVNAEVPYFRDTLDKIGVKPEFFQRKEYKTAYESMTNREMSAANKEMMSVLIGDMRDQLVKDITADRKMDVATFTALVNKGLLTADEALASGLIDHMDYADNMIDAVKLKVKGDAKDMDLGFVEMADYLHGIDPAFANDTGPNALPVIAAAKPKAQEAKSAPLKTTPKSVALIYAVGAIMTSDVNSSALNSSVFMDGGIAASDTIAPAILDAAADPEVSAIVLRIDSPGGSPAASEAILRALDLAQEQGKQIIVSMGSTAASGGYWIAAHADHIFVSRSTVTGSIGVLGGKFTMSELWEKLGINWETLRWGENADMWSSNEPFDELGAERMNAMLDNVYRNFITRVAKGRGMSVEEVDRIAKGRVWSGKRALEVGLADQEGGLMEALDYAAILAGGTSRDDVAVKLFPKPKTAFEQFMELINGDKGLPGSGGPDFQSAVLEMFGPVLKQMAIARDPEKFMTYNEIEIR